MQFVCKIVKDCVHSDGVRDYQFKEQTNQNLFSLFLSDPAFKIEERPIGQKRYLRIFHDYYRLFGFMGDKKLRVEFQDYHPDDARDLLEEKFASWQG